MWSGRVNKPVKTLYIFNAVRFWHIFYHICLLWFAFDLSQSTCAFLPLLLMQISTSATRSMAHTIVTTTPLAQTLKAHFSVRVNRDLLETGSFALVGKLMHDSKLFTVNPTLLIILISKYKTQSSYN